MSFVVEDGTGLSNANSYASLAEWTTYFTDRNNATALAYSDAEKQAALIYATRYLDDNIYWYSYIKTNTQSLGWPRASYLDSEGRTVPGESVPERVKEATIELGYQHLQSSLADTSGENVEEESYGDASIKYRGSGRSFSFIKVMLRDYGSAGGASSNTIFRA